MNNEIYFRRATKIVALKSTSGKEFAAVAAFDANLRKLGYALSGDLAVALMDSTIYYIAKVHNEVIAAAKEIKGVRDYRPMYPNFPRQVMEASEAELYINAIVHYWSVYGVGGEGLLPVYDKLARPELQFDDSKYKVVNLGSQSDFEHLMGDLVASKSAFSETDRNDIASLGEGDFVMAVSYVKEFKNRENKAYVAAQVLNRGFSVDGILFDTATDVLRLAVALSDGDISLAEDSKFRNFKRSERRFLMDKLDFVTDPTEDMLRYPAQWKRLGERLHPGEFTQFPTAQAGFAAVRENSKFQGFNAKVENLLTDNNIGGAVQLLKTRPGEFARRLDHVLRLETDIRQPQVLRNFAEVATKTSPTVLVQLRNQMLNREGKRVFFPKGSVAKMQIIKDDRPELSEKLRMNVARTCSEALIAQFRDRDKLGKVYVDEGLRKIAIPFGQRSASGGVKTLGRGSRLPLDASTGVLRFFIWWKNAEIDGYYNTDIDLSAVVLDENFGSVFDITYYNLREQGAVHSGDITNAPNGASEFIDIEIDKIKAQGGRYVAMTLHSYSGQNFHDMPEVFAGFMERQDLDSGEIYEPKTVVNKVDVMANSRSATPFIFDLETGEAVWVDLTMKVSGYYSNVASSKRTITDVVDAMVNLTPPNLYDLFTLHSIARGEQAPSRGEADVVYALDGDVTPFDTGDILANYL